MILLSPFVTAPCFTELSRFVRRPHLFDSLQMVLPVVHDAPCALCGLPDHAEGNDMLACDGCNRHWHQDCLDLDEIPVGDWYCPDCLVGETEPVNLGAGASAHAHELLRCATLGPLR